MESLIYCPNYATKVNFLRQKEYKVNFIALFGQFTEYFHINKSVEPYVYAYTIQNNLNKFPIQNNLNKFPNKRLIDHWRVISVHI